MEEPMQDLDFTVAAWESLYDAVDATVFMEQDAQRIYDSLKNRLRFISFGEYLKRYIYLKAEPEEPFAEVPLKDYQMIIREAFADNHTPFSFTPTTAKPGALTKNWLTQQTVKRHVVFLLGFGLGMSVSDVNMFLTKALREPEINPKDPFEAICWYCYTHGYPYLKFAQLWEMYEQTPADLFRSGAVYGEYTVGVRTSLRAVHSDEMLMAHLSRLKATDTSSHMSVTARECFEALYEEARGLIAAVYNRAEEEKHAAAVEDYRQKLLQNERLFDYEKRERLETFRASRRVYTREDVTESDMERLLCAAIPTDRHGNLTPSKASKLNGQFAGKRFSRQRMGEILAGNSSITRFDLITLNFFVFSQKIADYPEPTVRYARFLESMNDILNQCGMGELYIQNPYECFVLMCILSLDPLGTYADVWELSYDKE